METTLYKRNGKNDIIIWKIEQLTNNNIKISHGLFQGKQHEEVINVTLKQVNEYTSRVNAKRKEGYKALEDLYDNSPVKITDTEFPRKGDELHDQYLYTYLQTYLPKNNTTSEGFVLPMLAKTLEDNKPFEKANTGLLGQWKINGLRCIIGASVNENDLFGNVNISYHSRTGEDWSYKMQWMNDIILGYIKPTLLDMMINEGVCLDGELYIPGYNVNDINSFVKNTTLPQHYKLQYWNYDICCENMTAEARRWTRISGIHTDALTNFNNKEEHLNNKKQFITLNDYVTENYNEAIELRDKFISLGFEGLILRNPTMEYAFGKRNQSMFKFKKKEDGLFKIIDIKEDKRGLPIFILKNDINDELFECTLNTSQEHQKCILEHKPDNIGKLGLVEYRERSGIKEVPFHAKLIKISI